MPIFFWSNIAFLRFSKQNQAGLPKSPHVSRNSFLQKSLNWQILPHRRDYDNNYSMLPPRCCKTKAQSHTFHLTWVSQGYLHNSTSLRVWSISRQHPPLVSNPDLGKGPCINEPPNPSQIFPALVPNYSIQNRSQIPPASRRLFISCIPSAPPHTRMHASPRRKAALTSHAARKKQHRRGIQHRSLSSNLHMPASSVTITHGHTSMRGSSSEQRPIEKFSCMKTQQRCVRRSRPDFRYLAVFLANGWGGGWKQAFLRGVQHI